MKKKATKKKATKKKASMKKKTTKKWDVSYRCCNCDFVYDHDGREQTIPIRGCDDHFYAGVVCRDCARMFFEVLGYCLGR